MPDHAMEALPRTALVFGDEAMVAHVREAMAGHADIVYAASATEFEVSRLVSAGATATLVNLDGGDWLDAVETELHAAGIVVVYNDPEISRALEGWERARWLRHLVAKLRGSRDVDPPRPETRSPSVPAVGSEAAAPADEFPAPPAENAVIERPLSPKEIETMTVDFVAGQNSVPIRAAHAVPADAEPASGTGVPSMDVPDPEAVVESAMPFEPVSGPAAASAIASRAEAEPVALDFDGEGALDVDTEALSAMIDARLAEPEASDASDSSPVWREVSAGAVPPVPAEGVQGSATAAVLPDPAPTVGPASAVDDDADVLASLPPLDDWQLVEPDTAPAPASNAGARRAPEPVLSDAFAGLELVPMETIAPPRNDADPIQSWFAGEVGKPKAAANGSVGSGIKEVSHEHG